MIHLIHLAIYLNLSQELVLTLYAHFLFKTKLITINIRILTVFRYKLFSNSHPSDDRPPGTTVSVTRTCLFAALSALFVSTELGSARDNSYWS